MRDKFRHDRHDRRAVIAGATAALAAPLGSCAGRPLQADPSLVDQHVPDRELELYQAPALALYERGPRRALGWVAAVHGQGPSGPTADVVRHAFARIEPRAAILEGFPTARGAVSPEGFQRIALIPLDQGSETVVALREATRMRTEVWGGEPTDQELAHALVGAGFAEVDVRYALFFGPLEQDLRSGLFTSPLDPAFDAAFGAWVDVFGSEVAGNATAQGFRDWFAAAYGVAIENDAVWYERGWPGRPGAAGEIGTASNLLRDRHLYGVVVDRLNTHDRVVVVYGSSHLSNAWRALEALLGPPAML